MRKLYYTLWVDAITSYRKNIPRDRNWKWEVYSLGTLLDSLNLSVSCLWMKYFDIFTLSFPVNITQVRMIDGLLGFVISRAWPFMIINYFLIFYNDRYKVLLEKYPSKNGKYFFVYGITTAVVYLASLFAYGLLT